MGNRKRKEIPLKRHRKIVKQDVTEAEFIAILGKVCQPIRQPIYRKQKVTSDKPLQSESIDMKEA